MVAFCKAPLFSKNLEYLNLAIPFLWCPLIVLDLFFFTGKFGLPNGLQQNTLWDFIRNIIFLNSIHALFPYILLFRSTEIKNWIYIQKGGRLGFWFKLIAVQSFFFLFFFKIQTISSWATNDLLIGIMVSVLTIGLTCHHPLAQIRGISRLYDAKNKPTNPAEVLTLRKCQKREKYLFVIYTWAFVLFAVALFSRFPGPDRIFWFRCAFLILLPFCLGIILNFFSFPRPWNFHKLLYLLRILAFPCTFLSPAARIVTGAAHGIESFCVYRHMKERSINGKQWMNFAAIGLFFLMALAILFIYRGLPFLSWLRLESDFASRAITALALSFIFTHYYIEAILYRFRKPDCREHTLPLLVSSPLSQ